MIFRQLFEPDTSTYSYLLACERNRRALLIDPVAVEVDTYIEILETLRLQLRPIVGWSSQVGSTFETKCLRCLN